MRHIYHFILPRSQCISLIWLSWEFHIISGCGSGKAILYQLGIMIFQLVETQDNKHNKQSHGIVVLVSLRDNISLQWTICYLEAKLEQCFFMLICLFTESARWSKHHQLSRCFRPCLLWINSIWCQNGIKIQAVMFSNCVLIHLHKASPSGTNCFSQWIIYIFLFPYKHFPLWIIYVFFFFSFTCFFLHSSSPHVVGGNWNIEWGKKII